MWLRAVPVAHSHTIQTRSDTKGNTRGSRHSQIVLYSTKLTLFTPVGACGEIVGLKRFKCEKNPSFLEFPQQ